MTDAIQRAPLQAADLAGWTMRRATRVWLTGEEERSIPVVVLDALIALQHLPHRAGYLNRDNIEKFCNDHGVPKRGELARWAGVVRNKSRSGDGGDPCPRILTDPLVAFA